MSQTDRGTNYRTPRWVMVFGIIVLVLVLAVVVVLVTGIGGDHGPRRHLPPGGAVDTPAVALAVTDLL